MNKLILFGLMVVMGAAYAVYPNTCIQEDPASATIGDDNCGLLYTGNHTGDAAIYDKNWTVGQFYDNETNWTYDVNYAIPTGDMDIPNSALCYRFIADESADLFNETENPYPNVCDSGQNNVDMYAELTNCYVDDGFAHFRFSYNTDDPGNVYLECKDIENESNWYSLDRTAINENITIYEEQMQFNGQAATRFYEEGVTWQIEETDPGSENPILAVMFVGLACVLAAYPIYIISQNVGSG